MEDKDSQTAMMIKKKSPKVPQFPKYAI